MLCWGIFEILINKSVDKTKDMPFYGIALYAMLILQHFEWTFRVTVTMWIVLNPFQPLLIGWMLFCHTLVIIKYFSPRFSSYYILLKIWISYSISKIQFRNPMMLERIRNVCNVVKTKGATLLVTNELRKVDVVT